MSKPILFMMMGIPGAGKTTAAKVLAKITGAKHFSSDQMRLELWPKPEFTQEEHDQLYKKLDELVEQYLREGKSVIYDANLNRLEHRIEKYELCKKVNAEAKLVWVKADRDLARSRMHERAAHHLVPTWETPESMFERISDIMQPPQSDEKALIVDGSMISEEYLSSLI